MAEPPARGWTRPQRALHWTTAVLVLTGFCLAWVMVALPFRLLLLKFALYQAHKTVGLIVLALGISRLFLRAVRGRPAWDAALPPRQRFLARCGHAALYALLLAVPALGYVTAALAPIQIPTLFLGAWSVPHVIGPDAAAYALLRPLHLGLAVLLVLVAAGHAGMAIRHHRAGSDLLHRMWRG